MVYMVCVRVCGKNVCAVYIYIIYLPTIVYMLRHKIELVEYDITDNSKLGFYVWRQIKSEMR